jgi:hypothetical protein
MKEINEKLKLIHRIIRSRYPYILDIKYDEAKKVTLFVDIVFDYKKLTEEYLPYETKSSVWIDYLSLSGIFANEEDREKARKYNRIIEEEINDVNIMFSKHDEKLKIPYMIAINIWKPAIDTIPQGKNFY